MAIRILSWVGPIHIAGGFALFLTAFFPSIQQLIAEATGIEGENFSPFLFAVLGPTISSWGVLFCVVVRQFVDYPTRRLWNALVIAVLAWAPLDTGLCWYFGVMGGVAVNSVVVVLLLTLLFKVRPR
jgi:hypothetical protein